MKPFTQYIQEKVALYHSFYRDAVQAALDDATAKGWTWDDQNEMIMATSNHKPSVGKTTSWAMPVYKEKNGRTTDALLSVQIYGMDNNKYELNHYISR
jgi:hypothetical protein